jgi:hypothetical protein
VVVGHATPAKIESTAPGFGVVTLDQPVPFQRSASDLMTEPVEYVPMAMQFVVLGHDTAPSELRELPNAGAEIFQLVPSHCSVSVPPVPSPTALQLDSATHQTALSSEADEPDGLGLATTDHAIPFQRSTSVELPRAPTARQLVVLRHFTKLR